jgi:hypothetical protein
MNNSNILMYKSDQTVDIGIINLNVIREFQVNFTL